MIENYLSEDKAKRYLELLAMGVIKSHMNSPEYIEFCALSDESIAKQIEIYGEPGHAPFEGKCRRCEREFNDPTPEITHPKGHPEIACNEWCPDCNALVMSVVYRESSAYRKLPLFDPLKGGKAHAD